MSWLVDGNNLLGRAGLPTRSDDAKRALVGRLAAFARKRRIRVSCVFDGPAPGAFPTQLGSVSITFSGSRSADEIIVERAARQGHGKVVTADQGLAARVRSRKIEVIDPVTILAELEQAAIESVESGTADEWLDYFSDPKNRHRF